MQLKNAFRRMISKIRNSQQHYMLLAFVLFGMGLLLYRIIHTGTYLRATLIWNLFLAYIPFAITAWMEKRPSLLQNRYNWYLCFIVWLLFIPNAPYILTDLFHLFDGGVPVWYDLFLIFTFAWNGMVLGYLSIRSMEGMWSRRHSRWPSWLFTLPVMFLCSLGVYIGRYLRYNSWDVVKDPITLLSDVKGILLNPAANRGAWAFIGCMSIFLCIMYPMVINSFRRYKPDHQE
ncbi:DUF1361 domain-containing protein [Chitinophaga silvatica]|uniref:DUF1361 domain-containing protein n=1 Tax=Chitinophaga silvatica TaxID=2282649 RepID=A0A3E1Y9Z5_9BACT|nr:DUF1361 domain-containing protein [Chitinophaga silvatica]RFS22492.1 DUF1361 domain-containing protein [Chitinophaga silvatica]